MAGRVNPPSSQTPLLIDTLAIWCDQVVSAYDLQVDFYKPVKASKANRLLCKDI